MHGEFIFIAAFRNVTGIYALEPMTHLQTANNYPDMVALWTIQQFALLNQISMSTGSQDSTPFAGNSYPINASYTPGSMPSGVAAPSPSLPCSDCQGLDFNNEGSSNEALVTGIIAANIPGFYVFSAPWETISELLASINKSGSYNLAVPSGYSGPNHIHAITITPSGIASLVTFDSSLNPLATYPALPSQLPPVSPPCSTQASFTIAVTGGVGGAVVPAGINTNQTLYILRHAEAHPSSSFADGNLPYKLVVSFLITDPNAAQLTSAFFFSGGKFSNQTTLLGSQYTSIPPAVNALLSSYFPAGGGPTAPAWSVIDYDTIWTVRLDAIGNLTVNNALCEGIDSASLPATAPPF